MPFEGPALTSIHNPHVKYARSLQVRKNRYRERAFIVEGTRLMLDALDAGVLPRRVFFEPEQANEHLHAALSLVASRSVPVHPVAGQVIEAIADTQTPQGVVAIFDFPNLSITRDDHAPLLVVADGIKDPGNLGSLMRAALGAGADALYVSPTTVDPFSPKVVRAAMGAHFRIPLAAIDWDNPPQTIQSCGQRVGAEPSGSRYYDEIDWTLASTLVVGSEATGLSERSRRLVTTSVSIPLDGRIESLNAAIAGAVILFEAARQRRTQ